MTIIYSLKGLKKWTLFFLRCVFSLCEENEFVEAIIDRNEPPVEENTVVLRGGSGIYWIKVKGNEDFSIPQWQSLYK